MNSDFRHVNSAMCVNSNFLIIIFIVFRQNKFAFFDGTVDLVAMAFLTPLYMQQVNETIKRIFFFGIKNKRKNKMDTIKKLM